METKTEQIERLKKNLQYFKFMDREDSTFLSTMPWSDIVYLSGRTGKWMGVNSAIIGEENTYRIHHSYKPERDKPVFPGYELCEVKPNEGGYLQFRRKSYNWGLASAPNHGCCGYVPKEKLRGKFVMAALPICYMNKEQTAIYHALNRVDLESGDYIITNLGWVVFAEKGVE